MKKNNMLRIASVLLVAVLLSTCAISGAFAKYTTGTVDGANESARVAKWGITLDAAGGNALSQTYPKHSTTEIANTVEATAKAVAPGTNGTFGTFTIDDDGREVAARLTATATFTMSDDWTSDGTNGYFPIVIKVNGTPVVYEATAAAADIKTAVETAVCKALAGGATSADKVEGVMTATKDFAVGQSIEDAYQAVSVTWEWAFGDGTTDVADTYLGTNVDVADPDCMTFGLTFGLAIDQID